MQHWDNILNIAMIGTDKKQVREDDIPEPLQKAASLIASHQSADQETAFLQTASLLYNYRQCGIKAPSTLLQPQAAEPEENHYCSALASQVLRDILSIESFPLLKQWLKHCQEKQQIVPPELLPELLAKGKEHKKLQLPVSACCGKRGAWLGMLNEEWNFSSRQSEQDIWLMGTLEQRKETLRQLRTADPDKALDWLQEIWQQEDAATKTAFLEILEINIGEADLPFLESLDQEKSKKVKEVSMKLCKQIPQSTIVQSYETVLRAAVSVGKSKSLLGMLSKTTLQFKLPVEADEALYKTGIEKLSSSKDMTDDDFVLFQLIQSVPPTFWEQHLELSADEIIALFQKDEKGKIFFPAIVNATLQFRNRLWGLHILRNSQTFYIDIIPLLNEDQQELFSNKYFEKFPDSILSYALMRNSEWSLELTRNIFKYCAKNNYQYNRSFYNQHIHLIPPAIVSELAAFTPKEELLHSYWQNTSEYITRLISIKSQIKTAFNS